jgi:hypothetical protein
MGASIQRDNNNNIYDDFLAILHDFESLPDNKESESIFEIAGYPHYENVISNILAFYLNPNNEHGLGGLLLTSLINLTGGVEVQQENFQVSREVSTNNGGRIDIVIETDNQIIGIENKIFHHLNNNLDDYSKSIDDWAKPNNLDTLKIVLSIKKETNNSGFICVKYEDFIAKINENIGMYITTSSQKWILYLIDFLSTIHKLSGKKMEINKIDQFFIENEERVNSIIKSRNNFIAKLNKKIRNLSDLIQKPEDCERQWIYSKFCLVHDYNICGNLIAFDLHISPQGWELTLFGRDSNSIEYLKLVDLSNMDVVLNKDSRYILNKYDLSAELDYIKDDMIKWFGRMTNLKSSIQNLPNASPIKLAP